MTITTTKNNGCLTLELEGRLDTTTAPELETVIKNGLEGCYCIAKDKEAFICCIIPNRLTHMGLLLRFFKRVSQIRISHCDEV